MLNKWAYYIVLMLVFSFSSCKKEQGPWDKEFELEKDSTTMIYSMEYISNTSTSLTIDVSLLELQQLQTPSNYNPSNFSDQSAIQNVDYTVNGISQLNLTNTSYSTVLMLNLNKKDWYTEQHIGVYLQRFYEQTADDPAKKIAVCSFSGQQNTSTEFITENQGNIFGNSWQYNAEETFKLTNGSDALQYETSIAYLKTRMDEAINEMVAASPTGDKSITLLSNNDFLNTGDPADVDYIIDLALTNQIKINLIGTSFTDQLRQIANETGGFTAEYLKDFTTDEHLIDNTSVVSSAAVALQNLDRLLSLNVRIHKALFHFDYNDASTYTSGQVISYPINYNGYKFNIDFSIP